MFNLAFQSAQGTQTPLILPVGSMLFVVGANGTGKSSLMHRFYAQNYPVAKQISAHRQTWFSSSASTLSAHDKKSTETNIKNQDTNSQSRWMDHYSSQRASIAIYDLIDAENIRARKVTSALENNLHDEVKATLNSESPVRAINELLAESNIPIEISIDSGEQVSAKKNGGEKYSVAELSDGERNALLIAANVLTALPNSLILIDEPERHLHRSIISPLLTLLFARRTDCAFVVSTHDVMLPLDNPAAQTLLVRACTYSNSAVTSWDADLVEPGEEVEEGLKQDILGSRRKIIFVEGDEQSLDKPLYSLVFPFVSIIPKASCHEVERAVTGIRDSQQLHWLSAWGIVDNDRRTAEDIENLKNKGVSALPVFSVESIFYHPVLQQMIVNKQVELVGGDATQSMVDAKKAALNAIRPHIDRLSGKAVEKAVRDEMFKHLPRKKQIAAGTCIKVEIDVGKFVADERLRFDDLLERGDLQTIISAYPVRETPALDQIVEKLGFRSRLQYESAVRKLLNQDPTALAFVRSMFGNLAEEINV